MSEILTPEKQGHLAHIVTDSIWNQDLVDYTDDDMALKLAKQAIVKFVQAEMEVDQKARAKVASLKRGVMEGSPEWDILYRKYADEERVKSGKS